MELPLNGMETKRIQELNYWSMNWSQFKDPVSHMYLAGAVVVSWCITQEVADSSLFNDKYFCHWIKLSENI